MSSEPSKAAVVGLGVVGIPLALRLAEVGFDTVGLDLSNERVKALQEGRYPLEGDEPGIPELLAKVHGSGRFHPTTDAASLAGCEVFFLCVDTPFDVAEGKPDYRNLAAAARTVGGHLAKGCLVVVESTVAPGTTLGLVGENLEAASGLSAGKDFGLGHCPERVMPGKLLANLLKYDRVVGGIDEGTRARMVALYSRIVQGHLEPADVTTAEVVKTVENTYRDVQIAFANELAMACEVLGVDFWRVRELVNKVESRNVHMAGVGVGGHCIPKDPHLFSHPLRGKMEPAIVDIARWTNERMPHHAAELARRLLEEADLPMKGRRIAILGASYLPGTGDVRNTPSLPLAEKLSEWGANVVLVDPHVRHLAPFPVERSLDAAKGAAALILATAHREFLEADWAKVARGMERPIIVDGRGVLDPETMQAAGFRYAGIGRWPGR